MSGIPSTVCGNITKEIFHENNRNQILFELDLWGTLICLAIVCCLCFVGCDDNTDEQVNTPADEQPAFSLSIDQQINNAFSNSDRDATYDSVTATVTLSDAGHTVDGTGAAVEGNVVRIQNAGNYVISGTVPTDRSSLLPPKRIRCAWY